ncbi:Oidioi.mRNA.OKI2018_I69.chr1.g128.t1.cds [Oikopleura dioica]|uniref:Oidioi.mRNA.OKI2018_I69.chr1.g128.t1.cds n=1 Tax=Oikopleura dioica TaxID=34765 RepID=A0ABN7SIW3_OIKDI|nr:Oidioi.mRNA.OKI2018_I69.chr1.g128.t1.cds [Oikopleura dioica]
MLDIESILERFTRKTHLLEEGWRIIAKQLLPHKIQADYEVDFGSVDLTSLVVSEAHFPVSVTGMYYSEDGINTHQLILQQIEEGYFVLTLRADQDPKKGSIRIPVQNRFFLNSEDELEDYPNQNIDAFYGDPSGIEQETWYIFPTAYFLKIDKINRKPIEEKIRKFNDASIDMLSRVYTKRFSDYTDDAMPYLLNCLERTEAFDWKFVKFERNSDIMQVTMPDDTKKKLKLTPIMKEIIKDLEQKNHPKLYGPPLSREDLKRVQSFFLIETVEDVVEIEMQNQKWETAYIFERNKTLYLKIRGRESTREFPLSKEQALVFTDYKEEFQGEAIISKTLIDRGGEGLVMEMEVDGVTYAAKAHLFDLSILSHGKKVTDYIIDTDIFDDPRNDLVQHRNIIKHVANSRIFHKDDIERTDCLGWITFMPKMKQNLWRALENAELGPDERKRIARSIFEGKRFLLEEYRIVQTDLKASNMFVTYDDSAIKIGDFGLVIGQGDQVHGSYQIRCHKKESIWTRKLGYRRPHEKFLNEERLLSGTPGFTYSKALNNQPVAVSPFRRLLIFLTCEWFTAWNINFFTSIPLETIKFNFQQCGLDFEVFLAPLRLHEKDAKIDILQMKFGQATDPHRSRMRMIHEVMKMNRVVQISLDSFGQQIEISNRTAKSVEMLKWKEDLSRHNSYDFQNVTKHAIDQKSSELSVSISVTNLLRYAIKERLREINPNTVDDQMKPYTFDFLLKTLIFHIYPRNFDGMDLNPSPRRKYKAQQNMSVDKLLRRLEEKNFMFCIPVRNQETNEIEYPFFEGWKQLLLLIKEQDFIATSKFFFNSVELNENFVFDRPLTVSCCYITQDENRVLHENWHQLLLDRVDTVNRQYILQSSLVDESFPEMTACVKIPMERPYYMHNDFFVRNQFVQQNNYQYFDPAANVFMKLVNVEVDCGIKTNMWYLFPTAYSIQIIDKELYV